MPELTTLEKHFRTLYTSYINPNVTVYEDMIVYKVPASQALSTEYDLNNLIKGLSLPLIAIANKTHGIYTDSVVVKSKWNAENKNIVRYKLLY